MAKSSKALSRFSYLTIVPRGLQDEVCSNLHEQAQAVGRRELVDVRKKEETSGNSGISKEDSNGFESDCLKINIWNEREDNETMEEALRSFSIQKEEKQRKLDHFRNKMKEKTSVPPSKLEVKEKISANWIPPSCSVGTVEVASTKQHVSIGYHNDREVEIQTSEKNTQNGIKQDASSAYVPSWSCTGQMAGNVWIQLETNQKEIADKVISPSRLMGPLVALFSIQDDNCCLDASSGTILTSIENEDKSFRNCHYQNYYQHTLKEMTKEIGRHIQLDPKLFSERFDRALQLWKDCVDLTWQERLSTSEFNGLKHRIKENRLKFRVSCMRVEPADVPSSLTRKRKKKVQNTGADIFSYSRNELCQELMDSYGPQLVPDFYTKDSEGSEFWSVDLENFDVELVVFVLPPDLRSKNGKLAFGISLCPHSYFSGLSFKSGRVPTDVTAPCLGGDVISQGVVRLRPTTAHVLLQMANLQPYDVVVDPCAGVGTIPVETEYYQNRFESLIMCGDHTITRKKLFGIGGDVVLNNPKYTKIASMMENKKTKNNIGSSLLVAWDAAHLPLRHSCIDVAVSDLPFGQKCLSASALSHLLPLIFLETARVLRPCTGRMVMLAGGSPIGLIASIDELSGQYWRKPIPRVTPVSIGGILAWIIVVVRNEKPFDCHDIDMKLCRARNIAKKRDRISRQRKSEYTNQQTGPRKCG